jgi:hypothetical protein
VFTPYHKQWLQCDIVTPYHKQWLQCDIITPYHKQWLQCDIVTPYHKQWLQCDIIKFVMLTSSRMTGSSTLYYKRWRDIFHDWEILSFLEWRVVKQVEDFQISNFE